MPDQMVTVSPGDTVSLGCIVVENPSARLSWVRSGFVIRNNSRYTEQPCEEMMRNTQIGDIVHCDPELTENIKDDEDNNNDVTSTGNLISFTEVAKGRV